MQLSGLRQFNKDDRIYKIIFTKDIQNNIIKTIDTSEIYKIISIRNDFFGGVLTKFVSRDSAIIIPEKYISENYNEPEIIKKYGEYIILESVSALNCSHVFVVHV
jgi:hypothetical protein